MSEHDTSPLGLWAIVEDPPPPTAWDHFEWWLADTVAPIALLSLWVAAQFIAYAWLLRLVGLS